MAVSGSHCRLKPYSRGNQPLSAPHRESAKWTGGTQSNYSAGRGSLDINDPSKGGRARWSLLQHSLGLGWCDPSEGDRREKACCTAWVGLLAFLQHARGSRRSLQSDARRDGEGHRIQPVSRVARCAPLENLAQSISVTCHVRRPAVLPQRCRLAAARLQ